MKSRYLECGEEKFENGVCPDCGFSTIDKDNFKCPHCSGNVTIEQIESGKYSPKCSNCFFMEELTGIENTYKNTKEETIESWVDFCKNYPSDKVNSVFGFGEHDWNSNDDEKKLCLYVSDKKVWEKEGYCSDYTNHAEYEVLGNLGLGEDMEAIFSQMKRKYNGSVMVEVERLTKEQIHEKLVEAGFTYDEKFEEYMNDSMEE